MSDAEFQMEKFKLKIIFMLVTLLSMQSNESNTDISLAVDYIEQTKELLIKHAEQ